MAFTHDLYNGIKIQTNLERIIDPLATFNKIAFPLVRRVYSGLIVKDLVSVQPMGAPSLQTNLERLMRSIGSIFYLDYK
jgi:hypothetical protein